MLTTERKKQYRALGHKLNPIVTIADKGLNESVVEELNRALEDHELIKVKLAVSEREARKVITTELCEQTGAELVQAIGKTLLIYRPAAKPNAKLSNLLRSQTNR